MTLKPESPHGDPKEHWLGNSETSERNRQVCQESADQAKRDGAWDRARRWQAQADEWTALRDAEQRREELRRDNRRAHRRY